MKADPKARSLAKLEHPELFFDSDLTVRAPEPKNALQV